MQCQARVLRAAPTRRATLLACALAIVFPASALAVDPSQILSDYNQLRSANGIPGDLVLDQASSALLGIGQALASAGIWLVVVGLPIGLSLLILLALAIFVGRRIRRSGPPSQVILPPAEG